MLGGTVVRFDPYDPATQDDPFSFNPPPVGKLEKPLAPHRVLAREALHWKGPAPPNFRQDHPA